MTKYESLGIWDDAIHNMIDEIEDKLEISRDKLIDFFYEKGIEEFIRVETMAINEELIPYLEIERKFPHCFPSQIQTYKFKGWDAMRCLFLTLFCESNHEGKLEDIVDGYMRLSLANSDNQKFYAIEANLRTELGKHFEIQTDDDTKASSYSTYFQIQYKDKLAQTTDTVLQKKIAAHITFIQKAAESDIFSPRRTKIIQPSLREQMPLLPQPLPLQRRKTEGVTSATTSFSIFDIPKRTTLKLPRDDKTRESNPSRAGYSKI